MPPEAPVTRTKVSGEGVGRAMYERVTRSNSASASGPRELLVGDSVRPVGLGAQALTPVRLVGLEVALEPLHLRVALEREHVRADAVQEPAIVRDDHRAAGEVEQR